MNKCDKLSGQCDCPLNAVGYDCMQCASGFFAKNRNDLQKFGCREKCVCDAIGTKPGVSCESVGGQCKCKDGVEGKHCDSCISATAYMRAGSDQIGCFECGCDRRGSLKMTCAENKGQCTCKQRVTSRTCSECTNGYWNLKENNDKGCEDCACYAVGTEEGTFCNKLSGQCKCRVVGGITGGGRQCVSIQYLQ